MPPELATAIVALIGALAGGLGVTFVTGRFAHQGKVMENDQSIRGELWKQIGELQKAQERLNSLHEDCQRENSELRRDLAVLTVEHRELQKDFDELKARVEQ